MAGWNTWSVGEVLPASDLNAYVTQQDYRIKATDESVSNSTTQQDDNDLSMTVEANTDYILEAFFIYSAHTDSGLAFKWVFPSGCTGSFSSNGINTYTGDGHERQNWQASNLADITFYEGLGSGGISNPFKFVAYPRGLLKVGSTAGTFKMTWAQLVAMSDATVLRAHSYLRLLKLG